MCTVTSAPTATTASKAAPSRRRILVGLALTVGLTALGAGPARAGYFIDSVLGATCSPTNKVGETYWLRQGPKLLNVGSGPYDVFLASCPIRIAHPGWQPYEYHVEITDREHRDAYCRVYTGSGTLWRTVWTDWSSYSPIVGSLDRPLGDPSGWVEVAFECLLHRGASLDRVNIIWRTP